jgi:hypothetical protein
LTLGSEEFTDVDGVQDTLSCEFLNGVEGRVGGVIQQGSKILLKRLKSSLEGYLFLNNIGQGGLNFSWKDLVREDCWGNSDGGSISEVVVLAWQEHLDELVVRENFVSIIVKEGNEVVGLRFGHMIDAIAC